MSQVFHPGWNRFWGNDCHSLIAWVLFWMMQNLNQSAEISEKQTPAKCNQKKEEIARTDRGVQYADSWPREHESRSWWMPVTDNSYDHIHSFSKYLLSAYDITWKFYNLCVQHGSHQPHVVIEHLRRGWSKLGYAIHVTCTVISKN